MAVWNAYDLIVGPDFRLADHTSLGFVVPFSFFIYLFHQPALDAVRLTFVYFWGHNSVSYLFSYLLSPILLALMAIAIGTLLRKNLPRVYSVCTGGR